MGDTLSFAITHTTTYSFDQPVKYALQQLRMFPRNGHGQRVVDWKTTVTGGQKQVAFDDQFMNRTELVRLDAGAIRIEIISEGVVEVEDRNGVIGKHSGYTPLWLYTEATPMTAAGNTVRKMAGQIRADCTEMDDIARMHELATRVSEAVKYETGHTDAETTAEMALTAGHGVCQDQAHVMIAVARQLGYPARYVSGYLFMDGQVNQDASHAWCEVWTESLGWIGFDVANQICPDARYVRVAAGRDYGDAAPIQGVRHGAGGEQLQVSLQVQQ
ncbi:transglutaminase family protein [Fluviibacterium sp. DFM31]|uniref:Transglutaminase family protein n=1 Tax=Meridianimarinicoccus marinus TaxID=3231483 RepID=A0ABV3L935_9RHOB